MAKKMNLFRLCFFVVVIMFLSTSISFAWYISTTYAFVTASGPYLSAGYGIALDSVNNRLLANYYYAATYGNLSYVFPADPSDPLFSTASVGGFIRDRIDGAGNKFYGLWAASGAAYNNGKFYITIDGGTYTRAGSIWVMPSNDTTIVIPGISSTNFILQVGGVYTDANAAQSSGIGTNFFATLTRSTEAAIALNSTDIVLPDGAVNTITGVYTNANGLGRNFWSASQGRGYSQSRGLLFLCDTTGIPYPASSFPTTVWVTWTQGKLKPYDGTIYLTTPLPDTTKPVFVQWLGRMPGAGRGVLVYDANSPVGPLGSYAAWTGTYFPAQPGIDVVGRAIDNFPFVVSSTFLDSYAGSSCTTCVITPAKPFPGVVSMGGILQITRSWDVEGDSIPVWNPVRVTTAVAVSSLNQVNISSVLGGKPYYDITGVWTNASGLGLNFYPQGNASGNYWFDWYKITDPTKIAIDTSLWLGSALSDRVYNVPKGPIYSVQGVYTAFPTLAQTTNGMNFFTSSPSLARTGHANNSTGTGWYNVSVDSPTIYLTVPVDTTVAGDSVLVLFWSHPGQAFTPGSWWDLDTSGILNLAHPLPVGTSTAYVGIITGWIDPVTNAITILPRNYLYGASSLVAGSKNIYMGDTVYVTILAHGGDSAYNRFGPGTKHNRVLSGPGALEFDNLGNAFMADKVARRLYVYDSSWNLKAQYYIFGELSGVVRGIGVNPENGDIYVASQFGRVWKFTRTGSDVTSYKQDPEPFYFSNARGLDDTNGAAIDVDVVPLPKGLKSYSAAVYVSAPVGRDAKGPVKVFVDEPGARGVLVQDLVSPQATGTGIGPRGAAITADRKRVYSVNWSSTTATPQFITYWYLDGWFVPVELSRFESVID
ncbi:MAG: hypothetical protein N3A72_10060 [bacterium]|nr:hypothetical protein [bacterium]